MENDQHEREALYRFQIIATLINESFARGEFKKKLHELAGKIYEHPERGHEKFAFKTIEEWFYLYRQGGLNALKRKPRSDRGKARCIPEELGNLILKSKKEKPSRSVHTIIRKLIMAGNARPGELSRSSVYRLLSRHRWFFKLSDRETPEKKRYAFEFVNECWQGDVCHGPYLSIEGFQKKKKVYLHAFIDDASRVIPHAEMFFQENTENVLQCFKTAVSKRGIPTRLYLDNGSPYRSSVVRIVGARLGVRIIYCTPYSPYKKGKQERWFRTCRRQFLSELERNRRYTLEELNALLLTWIESDYHHRVHSTLGQTPLEAWQKKSRKLRYPDQESLDRDFLHEESRKVRKAGTFPLKGLTYEIDSHLAGERITIRYNPFQLDVVYAYNESEFIRECRKLDEIENQKTARQPGISFSDLDREENNDV